MADIPKTTEIINQTDLSDQMIAHLLGPNWEQFTGHGAAGTAATMAHEVLSSFNMVAMAAVTVLFMVTMVQGATGTANEGVPLGKRFSSLWMPLRFAFSMSALAPIVKGLSIFQMFLLMAIGFSVNMANYVWETGLEFFEETGGQLALQPPASLVESSQTVGTGILKSLVIQKYFEQRLDLPIYETPSEYIASGETGQSGQEVFLFGYPEGGSPGDLGSINIPCLSREDSMCSARIRAVNGLINELTPLAELLVDVNAEMTAADSSLLARAVRNYQLNIQGTLTAAADEHNARLQADVKELVGTAQSNGWVTAGAYYWNISQLNERARNSLFVNVTYAPYRPVAIASMMEDFTAVDNRLNNYLDDPYSSARSVGFSNRSIVPAEEYTWEWAKGEIKRNIGMAAMEFVVDKLQADDPISTLATAGNFVVTTAEAVIISTALGNATLSGLKGVADGTVVSVITGGFASGGIGFLKGLWESINIYLVPLLIFLSTIGFFLAYFLPATPLILWISAVVGWLILVVESLVAAPLWVAAHALPDGEGFVGNSGRLGYMLFLGIFLRPPLMVFGFLIAMCLMNGIGFVIGTIFSVFAFDFMSADMFGLASFLGFTMILGSIVFAATYKFFGLIVHLPDRVTNWIGQQLHSLGERGDVSAATGQFQQAGSISNKMGDAAVGGANTIGAAINKEKNKGQDPTGGGKGSAGDGGNAGGGRNSVVPSARPEQLA